MCGLGGIARGTGGTAGSLDLAAVLARMQVQFRHRGPDACGSWIDPRGAVGLAHNRLSIRDLSPAGAQPFTSRDGRWVLAYNGEIYNAQEVADALMREGHPGFRGHSDTEVLADAIAAWGPAEALRRCAGMFAFAAVDCRERTLVLARDRVGIKPLIWAWAGENLIFGSDTRVLEEIPGAPCNVDPAALDRYLRLGRVEGDFGLLRGVNRVQPGTFAEWRLDSLTRDAQPVVTRWWDAHAALTAARANPLLGTDEDVLDTVQETLAHCVGQHLVSDVPVGAFLSGGIDSSLIVALLRKCVGVPVRTFTIGFGDSDHDESAHAERVAHHLHTDHTQYRVGADDALGQLDALMHAWDEPFADTSAIPTLIVSALARKQITVVLTGDGGDEAFGGYDRYVWLPRVTRLRDRLGGPGRGLAAGVLNLLARPATARAFAALAPVMPRSMRVRQIDRKATRMAAALSAGSNAAVLDATLESWSRRERLVRTAFPALSAAGHNGEAWSDLRSYMLTDLRAYLVDDILTKLDRATMEVSLEGRVPYLDHRVLELAMRLPDRSLVRDGTAKWVLRQLLARYVPAELFERPKSGFVIPVGGWLRGPLHSWAERLLRESAISSAGVEPAPYLNAWREHQSGRTDRSAALWALLMYLQWLERHPHIRP